MTVQNDFLTFASASGANVITQPAYVALGAQQTGFSAGLASSAQLNKVWRQGSIISAVIAQYIVQQTGQTAIDDGTTATLLANFTHAIAVQAGLAPENLITGTSHTYVAADAQKTNWRQTLVSGGIMTDALSGAPGSLPTGWTGSIVNADPNLNNMLVVTAAPGATLYGSNVYNNSIMLGPGQQITVVYDGVNYEAWTAPIRAKMGTTLTIYVSTAGSDALNHGLTAAAPLASIQRAYSVAQQVLDVNSYQVICQLATVGGATTTYAGQFVASGYLVGQALPTLNYGVNGAGGATVPTQAQYGAFVIAGNASNPALTVVTNSFGASITDAAVIRAGGQASIAVTNFTLQSSVLYMSPLLSDPGSSVCVGAGMIFPAVAGGASGGAQIWASGVVYMAGNYTVSGSAAQHLLVNGSGARVNYSPITLTVTGNPNWGFAFANVSNCGSLYVENITVVGASTGTRAIPSINGTVNTAGRGQAILPGNANGSPVTGGQIV